MKMKLFGAVVALLLVSASAIDSAVADTFLLNGVVDIYGNSYTGSFDYSGAGTYSSADIVFTSPNYYAPVPDNTLFATIIVPDSYAT